MNPFQPPKAPDGLAVEASAAIEELRRLLLVARGRRVAGMVFLAAGVLSVVAASAPQGKAMPISIVLDFATGFLLVSGYAASVKIALLRVALGLCFGVYLAAFGDSDLLLLALLETSGIALLIVGKPTKVRFAVGSALVVLYVFLCAGTVASQLTGKVSG